MLVSLLCALITRPSALFVYLSMYRFHIVHSLHKFFTCAEVRPAPHMDNLVSIYKSMEVASGFNIFVTQTVPSTKISGTSQYACLHKFKVLTERKLHSRI